jgi:hypothetical protein
MAARKNTFRLNERWREKIQIGVIIDRLVKHAEGTNEMTNTQIKAAEILLKKVLPDVARTEVVGDSEQPITVKVLTGI